MTNNFKAEEYPIVLESNLHLVHKSIVTEFNVDEKVRIRGKFIYVGEDKFYIKGVTYGAFKADENKGEYSDLKKIDEDFAMMAETGFNTVRIPHTTPQGPTRYCA